MPSFFLTLGLLSLMAIFQLGRADAAENSPFVSGLPSRVVIVQDPNATQAFEPRPDVVLMMVNRGLTNLTSQPTPMAAWRTLISTQDTVGLKVFSAPGARSGTRPAVVGAVIESLLDAGLSTNHIVIWDKNKDDLSAAGFYQLGARYGVRVEASISAGWDESTFYETPLLGELEEGDLEYKRHGEGVGRKSYVSKLVSKGLTKVINITPLLNSYRVGVTGNLYSLALGSVDNTRRFFGSEKFFENIVEIYTLDAIYDRVVLNIVDALIGQYEGERITLLHYASAVNELRFSTDPVALDILSIQELQRLRGGPSKGYNITNVMELYHNASLMKLGVSNPSNIRIEKMAE